MFLPVLVYCAVCLHLHLLEAWLESAGSLTEDFDALQPMPYVGPNCELNTTPRAARAGGAAASTAAAPNAKSKVPLLKNYDLKGCRLIRKAVSKTNTSHLASATRKGKADVKKSSHQAARQDPNQRSLNHFLGGVPLQASAPASSQSSVATHAVDADKSEPHEVTCTSDIARPALQYIETLKRSISSGELPLRTGPWVHPTEPLNEVERINKSRQATGQPTLDSAEVRSLIFRPLVFVWAPHLLFNGVVVACPKCKMATTGAAEWKGLHVVHLADQDALLIATRHACSRCPASTSGHSGKKSGHCFRFSASSPEAIALLPEHVQDAWALQRVGYKTLCAQALVDTIRAWATRATWAATAAALNELRATRSQMLERKYAILCRVLQLEPVWESDGVVPLTARQVSLIYDEDFRLRTSDVVSELLAEVPGDILSADWTKDAAARCSGKWVFNAMDSNGKILASVLASSTRLAEAEPVLRELQTRGLKPKVIYVDDECCGAWKDLAAQLWPGASVVLDAFHAIRRLTQTTASTQHPWHKQFCGRLSQAIFTYDAKLSFKFRQACARAKVPAKLARRLKAEHVPRFVNEKGAIEVAIGDTIAEYSNKSHPEAGPLLTAKTFSAWEQLKRHIRAGCLCDPPGAILNTPGAKSSSIGGESFQKIHVKRGSSALEGFHLHQKNWLGPHAHSRKRGLALLADGSVRFNRRRRNTESQGSTATPPVFSAGLLAATDRRYREFIAQGASRLRGVEVTCPVRDVSDTRLYSITLPPDNGLVDEQPLSGNGGEAAHRVSDAGPPASRQESPPCAEKNSAAASSPVTKTKNRKTRRLPNADEEGTCRPEVHPSNGGGSKTVSSRRCRRCRVAGSGCRYYNKVQWCERDGVTFDEWVASVFPEQKAAAESRSERRAARAGMPRGRPSKKGDDN